MVIFDPEGFKMILNRNGGTGVDLCHFLN